MSHHILYGKLFVRLSTGDIIPMVLGGDNNVTENVHGDRWRRARDFYCSRSDRHFYAKPEVIVGNAQKDVDNEIESLKTNEFRIKDGTTPEMVHNNFGYYVSVAMRSAGAYRFTSKAYVNFYKSGCDHAKTFAELRELNIGMYFYRYEWHGETTSIPMPDRVTIRDDATFFEQLQRWVDWCKVATVTRDGETNPASMGGVYLHFDRDCDDIAEALSRAHRAAKRKKEFRTEEQDHFFAITDGHRALVRYTRRGFKYAYTRDGGKRFRTQGEADRFLARIVREKRYECNIWKVERIERKVQFRVAA